MQGSTPSGKQPSNGSNSFSVALQQANSIFTLRRVSYAVAGAFVFAGAAVALQPTGTKNNASTQFKDTSVKSSSGAADSTAAENPSDAGNSSPSSVSSSASNGSEDTHVTIDGQEVPVPSNGSTQQTTTNNDGSTTTTTISHSTSSQGSASNASHTSFSLNVSNSSSTSGGPTNP